METAKLHFLSLDVVFILKSEGAGGEVLSGHSSGALIHSVLGQMALPGSAVRTIQRSSCQETPSVISLH